VDKKKVIMVICIIVLMFSAGFFISRALYNRSAVDTNTELYNDTIAEIGKLRTELGDYTELIGELEPGLAEIAERIESSQRGIESSLGILSDITTSSGEIGNIARELNSDITDIREASLGLAEMFGVSTEEN